MKKTIAIMVGLVLLMSVPVMAAVNSGNLLDNPSATSGMDSWDATANVEAVATQPQTAPAALPRSDPNFFTMADTAGADANMIQIIDLTTLIGTPIGFDANGWIQTELYPDVYDANITANDYGELVVEFLDPCGIVLGSFATGPIGNPVLGGGEPNYVLFSESNSIPDGAVEAVYTLYGTLVGGSFINVFYDDLGFSVDLEAEASIEKTFDRSDANLGDHVTVTLTVENPYDSNVTVIDCLDSGLKYIPLTMQDNGQPVTPTLTNDCVITEVNEGLHEIVFDVQVTGVQAQDSNAQNCASVSKGATLEDSNCATLTLHPYEGFSKDIDDWDDPSADPNACETCVPIHEEIHWWLLITVENITGDDVIDMNDMVVSDRFGGDLRVDDVDSFGVGEPNLISWTKGRNPKKKGGETEKVFLTWTVGDVNDGSNVELLIEISTDVNPGQKGKGPSKKNEYTSTGEHCLNSGAVLKFTDPETGFLLSAHTPEICVWAFDPDNKDDPVCPDPYTCP